MGLIPGARIQALNCGALTFTTYQMGEGPLALCLHGFPDTPVTWRHLLPRLADAGYRAVAVTSRGYEPGSQPQDGDYSLPALAGDVVDWIDALGAQQAHLIGHDWGSSILHAAAARSPDRVLSLTALAVPHPAGFAALVAGNFVQLERSWYVFFFQMHGLADLVLEQGDGAFLEYLWRRWSPGWEPAGADMAAMKAVFADAAVRAAALAYYRTAFVPDHPRAVETQSLWERPIQAPVLGLTGARDGCVSAEVFRAAMPAALYAQAPHIEEIQDAGHFLHLEAPDEVASQIVAHLKESPTKA